MAKVCRGADTLTSEKYLVLIQESRCSRFVSTPYLCQLCAIKSVTIFSLGGEQQGTKVML